MFNCQVFYHKGETNYWKATIAFFPKEKMKVKINLGSSNAVVRLCIMYCKHRKSMSSTRMLTTVNVLMYNLKAAKLN